MAASALYVGLDHSLTAFGLAAVSGDWGLDFRRVRRVTLTTKPGPAVPRRAALAADVATWVQREAAYARVPLTAVRVAVEGGIFMRDHANTIRSQERLAAIVEDRLGILGLEVAIAEQREVRTTFLGRHKHAGAGALAQAEIRKLVGPSWDEAELDAFLVANRLLELAGEAFVCVGQPGAITAKDWTKHNPGGPLRGPTRKPRAA